MNDRNQQQRSTEIELLTLFVFTRNVPEKIALVVQPLDAALIADIRWNSASTSVAFARIVGNAEVTSSLQKS